MPPSCANCGCRARWRRSPSAALLALAGALMQVLLRNPLADPYILGISGGAAVGALARDARGRRGARHAGGARRRARLDAASCSGSRAPAPSARRGRRPACLLTGVVVAAGWGAVIALLLTLAPDAQVKGMLFWLIGDLGGTTAATPALVTLAVALAALARVRAGLERAVARRGRGGRAGRRGGAHDARAVCASRRSRPRRRSRRPAASGSSGSSSRTRFDSSSATTSACCCRRACSPAARCSCSPTRWRARSSRRFSCPSA